MITVLHILGDANYSGAPAQVLDLALGLSKKEFKTLIIGPEGPMAAEFARQGISYHRVPMRSKFDIGSIGAVRQTIEQLIPLNEPVIIHCHGARAGLIGRLAARSLGHPIVYTEHIWTADYHLPNQMNEVVQISMLRWLDRYTAQTVAVSKAVADFLVQASVTSADKLEMIYHGLNFPKTRQKVQENNFTIGTVGSLTWQKNYAWLIELMPTILEAVPDARLEIVGDGEQHDQLQGLIDSLNLGVAVKLIGAVRKADLSTHFERWGLYVQPSVNESFGLALAEAMAYGLPTLGSAAGSIPEITGTKSATFDLNNKEKAAQIIIHYLKNHEDRAKLQADQGKHIQQFTMEKMFAGYARLYQELTTP